MAQTQKALTQAEREERDKDEALKEHRAFERIARQMEADLEARGKAQVEPPTTRDADLGARLAPAFMRQLADGETQLRERLQAAGLSYGAAELIIYDYHRQADPWGRPVQVYHPPIPLAQVDIEALQQYLTSMAEQIITHCVEDAVDARDVLRVKAGHVLTDSTRHQRKAPMDDATADKRDSAAHDKLFQDTRPQHEQHLTVEPVLQTEHVAGGHAQTRT